MSLNMRNLYFIIIAVVVLLFIPLLAMQFTKEVNWDLFDFIAASVLLMGAGLAGVIILMKVRKIEFRFILLLLLIMVVVITWAELAVGIFGSPLTGN